MEAWDGKTIALRATAELDDRDAGPERGDGGVTVAAGAGRTAPMSERGEPEVEPLDEAVDHVRRPAHTHVILEYGDYECPYSRQAYREIQRVERRLGGNLRFAFRHFPLTEIHPHALAAAGAAEAAALQGRYWEMHEILYHRQKALDDTDLRESAGEILRVGQ